MHATADVCYESIFRLNALTFLHAKEKWPPKGGTLFHADHTTSNQIISPGIKVNVILSRAETDRWWPQI